MLALESVSTGDEDSAIIQQPCGLLRCSWPRPVEQSNGFWISEPDWQAPEMPYRPQPRWASIEGEYCWLIDWRELFRSGLRVWSSDISGEMRQFHVIFEILVHRTGTLVFWDDDGSIIVRNGETVHADRTAHPLKRHEIIVRNGDRPMIAQWQLYGGWLWGAKLLPEDAAEHDFPDVYRSAVLQRLNRPSGPPIKCFVSGETPLRAVVAIYSLVLNGYAPSSIIVFGEHQWSAENRMFFAEALPFAEFVPTTLLMDRIQQAGGPCLVNWSKRTGG